MDITYNKLMCWCAGTLLNKEKCIGSLSPSAEKAPMEATLCERRTLHWGDFTHFYCLSMYMQIIVAKAFRKLTN